MVLTKEKLKHKFNVRGVDIYLKPVVNNCKIENLYDTLKSYHRTKAPNKNVKYLAN